MADTTETVEDQPLTEEQLADAGPLIEAASPRLIIPKRGKVFEEDGSCKIAIIRPCVSRGRRLGPMKLPPIYTPRMLAENAGVFGGWLMYMDHLTEEVVVEGDRRITLAEAIVEAMARKQRSIRDLGGRVLESFYDPEHVGKDDEDYGYQKGAVIGRAIPRRTVREMLEDDPELLHVSINAWPSGARPGVAPWDKSLKGMVVEGIRKKPAGTVDWVPRGGAGGRVLAELETVLERLADDDLEDPTVSESGLPYDSANDMKLADLNKDQLVEKLRAENPDLARELGLAEEEPPRRQPASSTSTAPEAPGGSGGISEEELDRRLEEQRTQLLSESEGLVEDRANELLQERENRRQLADVAKTMITRSGLPQAFQADLLRRWSILPSGPSAALSAIEPITEGEDQKDAETVLKEAVERDLRHAAALIESAGGRPRISGLGGGDAGAEHQGARRRTSAFRDFLRESGDIPDKLPEGKTEDDVVSEMLTEGVRE